VTLRRALFRAVAAYRLLTLVYAAVLIAADHDHYARPNLGWTLLGVMAVWSAIATLVYATPIRRVGVVLVLDVAVAAGMVLATLAVDTDARIDAGAATLPAAWAAAAVLACAVQAGPWGGAIAGLAVSAADVVERGDVTSHTFNGVVLLLLAGGVGGYLVRLALAAERSVAEAVRAVAAVGERERLAREIHDSTLQVLALFARRGREIGGETAELAELAAAQEASLRALVSSGPAGSGEAATDLRAGLAALGSSRVSVATPGERVELPRRTAEAVIAAVAEA
jgi:signal transduction histidine kinase